MNGIVFVVDSLHINKRIFWLILLLSATGAMTFHLYSLILKYLDYAKHSDINIGFSSLEFPAVTICNVNIMRVSKVENASDAMQDFMIRLSQNNLETKVGQNSPGNDVIVTGDESDTDEKVSMADFLDTFDDNFNFDQDNVEDLFYDTNSPQSWEAVANRSTITTLVENFKDLYSFMNITDQKSVGHQLGDMLRQCSFATRKCERNFSQSTNSDYGNCYTIQDARYVSKKSGPSGGLELILYLEIDEYLPLITSGKGAHIVIHDKNTVPLPEEEGIAVSAGQQTMIGLKQIKITRLGNPYVACKNVDDFYRQYKVNYTRNLCQKMCFLKQIYNECKCLDTSYYFINVLLKINGTKTCLTSDEVKCVTRIKVSFRGDNETCGCYSPCSERIFDTYVSSRAWPNNDLLSVLVKDVCTTNVDICQKLKNQSELEIRENFLKLNLFYRDLNYEELAEQPNYEIFQLLSDFGGTLGLWIGLSVLSLFEIINVIAELLYCLICNRRHKRN
ncbi:amiloride-sensitive sodium channel subunit gamma-2 [Biomphalaria pfeifferi]|uniref:Amiloride-sensitive sodium channel subunit gamma-2 n=1 Tax=Biomphalaria pfeifferi TaxID=112525 RepID=A0AAD8BJY1_BIOPF|nr:amiloride-sensitive sodium channel subunit gamma-2 [Biomphalaria pfeifferi]